MIKGVNRQIIEVTQTGSDYFERAWLVVKPEYESLNDMTGDKEAESYLSALKPPYSMRRNKLLLGRVICALVSAAAGSTATLAALYMYGAL